MSDPTCLSAVETVTRGQIPEILQMIFEHGVLDWELKPEIVIADLWLFLRAISCVSTSWRSIAHRTPRLWRNLWNGDMSSLDTEDPEDPEYPEYSNHYRFSGDLTTICFGTETSLIRSGHRPLRVIGSGTLYVLKLLQYFLNEDLERVQHCYITQPHHGDHWLDGFGRSTAASTAEALRNISLPNMKHLTLASDDMDLPFFISLLSNFASLRSLALADACFSTAKHRSRSSQLMKPVTVLSLKELSLLSIFFTDVSQLFAHISAPALETLALFAFETNPRPMSLHQSRSLQVAGTWDLLRTLSIGGAFSLNDILGLLTASPNLKVFEVYQFWECDEHPCLAPEDILESLMVEQGRPASYVTSLRTLKVMDLRPNSKTLLHRLVESRLRSNSCCELEEVCIDVKIWSLWSDHVAEFSAKVKIHAWTPGGYPGMTKFHVWKEAQNELVARLVESGLRIDDL